MAVQSLERAFGILRALSLGPAGVTELGERTGLPKSTVSRLLASLEAERAVDQNADGAYVLGAGIAELAQARRGGQNLIDIARPHMVELMELAGEAVGLNRLEGSSVRVLAQIDDPESSVVVRDWTGETVPAHAVPAGLAILAHSSPSVVDQLLTDDLIASTRKTITDPNALRARLAEVKEAGYSWVVGEFDDELTSVAAPISDVDGRVIYAIHVHGPSYRFPGTADRHQLGLRVAATADRIESQLLASLP